MSFPNHVIAARGRIAASYLAGDGIEIGALDAPTPLPTGTTVRYVDRQSADELRRDVPTLSHESLVHVDVVDNGGWLDEISDGSLDFVIANRMLEHCENPLGMLRTHLRKTKPGGWLLYAIPEARTSADAARARTTFEHLMDDDADGGASSRLDHYVQWATHVERIRDEAAAWTDAEAKKASGHRIRFHVWDASGWLDFLSLARQYLGDSFDVWHFELAGEEVITVLRRSHVNGVADRLPTPPRMELIQARFVQRHRDMLGPFSWAIDSAIIADGMLDVGGWLYTRDDDPGSVLITVNGKPFDEVSVPPGERSDLVAVFWYTPPEQRRLFRLRKRLADDDARAVVLRLSARWSGGEAWWYVPGPVALDAHLPMPDDDRIARVAGPITPAHFRALGCNAFYTLKDIAARHGVDLGNAGDVLDWGVGCARTERFWQGDARLVGCDVDFDNIEWCRANLPGRFETIATEPPTAWPDASFDLIFGISVISHLRDEARRAWYGELRRLARPKALVMLSFLGDQAIAKAAIDSRTLAHIDEHGSLFIANEQAIDKLLGDRKIYGVTFQSSARAAVEARAWFDVLEVVPAAINSHQDLLVLRRRD